MIKQLFIAAALAASLGSAMPARAQVTRTNWIPDNGFTNGSTETLGDLWTFSCPLGGHVSAMVDTLDDTNTGYSNINPRLVIRDGKGTLVSATSDGFECQHEPVCGGECPLTYNAPCGLGGTHSILIADDIGDDPYLPGAKSCVGGGGYKLSLVVTDASNHVLTRAS